MTHAASGSGHLRSIRAIPLSKSEAFCPIKTKKTSNWWSRASSWPDCLIDIMITAYGDADTKRKALEDGAEALLTKPIDFVALRTEIDSRIERAA